MQTGERRICPTKIQPKMSNLAIRKWHSTSHSNKNKNAIKLGSSHLLMTKFQTNSAARVMQPPPISSDLAVFFFGVEAWSLDHVYVVLWKSDNIYLSLNWDFYNNSISGIGGRYFFIFKHSVADFSKTIRPTELFWYSLKS